METLKDQRAKLALTKESAAHVHTESFDTEDQAFAFSHGVHIGIGRQYCEGKIAVDYDQSPSVGPDGENVDANAFIEGIRMGIRHVNRVTTIHVECFNGHRVIVNVAEEK